ncbi:uncharacterized protein LOC141665583 [Apium graveolens]|uniref:uncharacterized protein LOC141665583 n=1 Tax=Apium graveolens TaxID=4045 RepID=UPI003D79E82D
MGHITEQCYQLSNLIESKIRKGHFVHYIEGHGQTHQRQDDRVVDVIFGGYAAGGMSNNSRKSYAREVCNINPQCPKRHKPSPSLIISFSDEDYAPNIIRGHQDALVITAKIGTNTVKKIFVDNGSLVDVLYHHAFAQMDIGDRKLENTHSPLYGITGNEVKVVGTIDLPVLFGTMPCQMKFPTEFGVGEMCGDQAVSRQCYFTTVVPKKQDSDSQTVNKVIQIDPSSFIDIPKDPSFSPVGETVDVVIDEHSPEKMVKMGKYLSPQIKDELTRLLWEFSDIFAWSPSDMPGIPTDVARHSLHVDCQKNPVKQKRRTFSKEKRRAIEEELDRLLVARFIEPVKFPTWIANVVLVKKRFLVSQWGIEADPSQIKAISEMKDPSTINEVQRVTGCIAALQRFIPQASKKCSPFFKVIKEALKNKKLIWDDQCKESFEVLKTFLTSPPVLARALPRETLKAYISAFDGSVASVLVKDVDGREALVYYVSHTLKDAETCYPHVEKLVYALVVASRKLRHYFQGRLIKVMTDQPLKCILHKLDMTGRLAAWTVELNQFHIEYLPQNAVKPQILSDFVIECKFNNLIIEETSFPQKAWNLYVDGSSTSSSGDAGVILINPEGFKIQQALKFSFPVTNNVAEYEALLAGLRLAIELEVKILEIFGDSQLVVKLLQGEFKAYDARMSTYLKLAMSLLEKVSSWTIKNIYREDNQWADALSKLASFVVTTTEAIYVKERSVPSIDMDPSPSDMLKVNKISSIKDWRQPILEYILHNKLPQDKGEARSISDKAKNYCVLENKLY